MLGIDGDDGVFRVSLLHYNTEDEVRGLVKVLDEVLKKQNKPIRSQSVVVPVSIEEPSGSPSGE